ncbi:MAG: glycosyltransferase family protein, partial [Acidimicrobiia bacterium]
RFPVPVERFPFGVAPEVFSNASSHAERPSDLAFVGAHLVTGGPYRRRQTLLRHVSEQWPAGRVALAEDVSPEEVAALYGSARIVLNEGGERHFPITMRVFEAIGCGALLVSDPVPGLELLFEEGRHFLRLEEDPVAQLRRLLARPDRVEAIASAAREHALLYHTYDHRVDELLDCLQGAQGSPPAAPAVPLGPLARLIAADLEVQRIVTDDPELRRELPEHEIWHLEQARQRLVPGAYDAVALRTTAFPPVLAAARRYVYAQGPAVEQVAGGLPGVHPHAEVQVIEDGSLMRADLHGEGYRISEGPSSDLT